ncbi:EH signature domain-containing protein [Tistrella mobilis]|uniref:EH signature domain-containing protein n=1 Tax=Tistrella mobilis TaxID=171437 RepID=UPI0035572801
MTGLGTLLSDLRRLMPSIPRLHEPRALSRSIDAILKRWPGIVPVPAENDRDRLVAEMLRRLHENDWTGVPLGRVTCAAHAAFDEDRRNRPHLAPLRSFYVDETRASTRPVFLAAMLSVYMSSYQPGATHSAQLAAALQVSSDRLNPRWRRLLAACPALLDAERAHLDLGQVMYEAADPGEALRSRGLQDPHTPGLMDFAHQDFVRRIAPDLHDIEAARRLLIWLKPAERAPRHSGAPMAIDALLTPWVDGQPGNEHRQLLVDSLISAFGDPRIRRSEVWTRISEASRSVIIRWLTGENIRFFMDVVSEVEQHAHWPSRRAFWLELYERGEIRAAWVAFSPRAARLAKRKLNLINESETPFGRQIATGKNGERSLLILETDHHIIVEGSHNYRIHLFRKTTASAPRLFERTYDCAAFRRAIDCEHRIHDVHLKWQNWVKERI